MANAPSTKLVFGKFGADCGQRQVEGLPLALPSLGDDFDYRVRDYDGFRLFMLEELAARIPERGSFNPADMEVVLVEVLAAVLDQLSDMADRVFAEAYLETARRPESVRRLLNFVGYDAVQEAIKKGQLDITAPASAVTRAAREAALDQLWLRKPHLMEAARTLGPRTIHRQQRMVTAEDYAELVGELADVQEAGAYLECRGGWSVMCVVVRLRDKPIGQENAQERLQDVVKYVDRLRMVGQEFIVLEAQPVGVCLSVSVQVQTNYFQWEVRHAVAAILGNGPGGFFDSTRMRFGYDVHASDLIQALTALEGVDAVSLNAFRRYGGSDMLATGVIVLDGFERAVCENVEGRPQYGSFELELSGGMSG